MSWSTSFKVFNGEIQDIVDVDKRISEISSVSEDQRGAVSYAIVSALDIIRTGNVGDPKGTYTVSLSGHVNPDHKPTAGWANDAMNISIYQV